MLEKQVAELLATHLSRFIKDVNAEQLEVSLWSGNVVLNNVHLRADVLERITALLHGESGDADSTDGAAPGKRAGGATSSSSSRHDSSAADAAASASPSTASMRMLLAPFTVVQGVIRHLTIRVPWASLESESIHVQVTGVELVLGPLRARPFNALEEQEREEAIKQQQLACYEEARQRSSQEAAAGGDVGSRSSSGPEGVPRRSERVDANGNGGTKATSSSPTASAAADEASSTSWLSWIWDFDRISQIALRNLCLTLHDVRLRYEFDYEGLHPALAAAAAVFVREVRVTTTNQRLREMFVSDLSVPLCKRVVLSDIVVSTHAVRLADPQGGYSWNSRDSALQRSSPASASQDGTTASAPHSPEKEEAMPVSWSSQRTLVGEEEEPYDAYQSRWAFSKAVVAIPQLELQAKMIPPGCTSLDPIVEGTPPLATSSTELTVGTSAGVQVDVCFGAAQALESMWRSYHRSLGCARYRKRLHLLRLTRRSLSVPPQRGGESGGGGSERLGDGEMSKSGEGGLSFASQDLTASRLLARQRWQFALRCVLDDVQQQRQTFRHRDRERREVIEGMVKFCQVRRAYCQYWKRTQNVSWAPPLDPLEEKKLSLMERQLTLAQVIFLRCLSYAEMRQEEEGFARQRAFIDEARQRKQKSTSWSAAQQPQPSQLQQQEQAPSKGKRSGGLWGWFARPASPTSALEAEEQLSSSTAHAHDDAGLFAVPSSLTTPALSDIVMLEWAVGQRYTFPPRAALTQPTVPQSFLPDASPGSPTYFTLRCVVDVLTLRLDPVYWPLVHDSSVPPPPLHTPLRRLAQQFCVRLRAVEMFGTTVPDERPDRAACSFFVGSARLSFEGVLRSVLLQSKEVEGEDFIIVKQNASRTHVGVWVAPQLVVCQPLHEWQWWSLEVAAFVDYVRAMQMAFYTPLPPTAAAATVSLRSHDDAAPLGVPAGQRTGGVRRAPCEQTSAVSLPSQSPPAEAVTHVSSAALSTAPPLVWNVTLQAIDVCIPLVARDITEADLEIIDHLPSGLSSLVMTDSLATAVPLRSASVEYAARKALSPNDAHCGAAAAAAAAAEVERRGRPNGQLHDFIYDADLHMEEDEGDREGDGDEADSTPTSVVGSFASTVPDRCFLSNDACLVLSISTTRLATVSPARKRSAGCDGGEYYLCIGDPDKAVRVFCQKALSPATLATNRHLELLSFAAGEVLITPDELSIVFNKGIDVVVEPDAFATLNDGLLKPAVFTSIDAESRMVQSVTEELRDADAAPRAEAAQAAGSRQAMYCGLLPPPVWRLASPGCVEMFARVADAVDAPVSPTVVRHFRVDCARHIITALLPTMQGRPRKQQSEGKRVLAEKSGAFGGRTVALGVSVARLLLRSLYNEDTAEVVLVAPEVVPLATTPYRGALAALGVDEPRAVELIWCPSASQESRAGQPEFLLSVPDLTMTTAVGQKLCTVEQLTVVQTPAVRTATGAVGGGSVVATVEAVSLYVDMVLVDLVDVAIGTVCALRMMEGIPLHGAEEAAVAESESAPPMTRSLRVQSTRLQAPLTKSSVDGVPYCEWNALVQDFCATLLPEEGELGSRVSVGFSVPEANQVVDDTGSDPDTRSFVTALPWSLTCGGSGGGGAAAEQGRRPLTCTVEVALPAAPKAGVDDGKTSEQAPATPSPRLLATTTCHIAVSGGAVHAYFPFLYLLADVVAKDARLQRLKQLPASPLFYRGFTSLSAELLAMRRGEATPGSAFSTPTTHAPEPTVSTAPTTQLRVTASVTDVDVFLATDAAVPIDVGNLDTMCVVHVAEVRAGFHQAAAASSAVDEAAMPATFMRTQAHLDTVALYLLDLASSQPSSSVRLPNLQVRAESGVLLLPKPDASGYLSQRGGEADVTVRMSIHPPSHATTDETQSLNGGDVGGSASVRPPTGSYHSSPDASVSGPSMANATATSGVLIELGGYQCRTLLCCLARNVAQSPVAKAQEGRAWKVHEEAAQWPRGRRGYTARTRRLMAASVVDPTDPQMHLEGLSSSSFSGGLTLLVNLPASSLVLRAEDTAALLSRTDYNGIRSASSSEGVAYEFALRGGGQLYAAVGGRWQESPVANGQLRGLELSARGSSAATPHTPSPPPAHFLLTADSVGLRLAEQKAAPPHEGDHSAACASSTPLMRTVVSVHRATVRVPHVQWWLRLYALVADAVAESTPSRSALRCLTPAPLSLQDSFTGGGNGGEGPARHRDTASSRRSSVLFGPRGGGGGVNRGVYRGGGAVGGLGSGHTHPSAAVGQSWGYGAVELHDVQLTLGESATRESHHAASQGHQQGSLPWCRLVVPEARLTASPQQPQSRGEAREYDAYYFDVPQCPQLLLLASSAATTTVPNATVPHPVYVSVLKMHAGQTDSGGLQRSCLTVQLLRSPSAHLISGLRYGRSYHMTDINLHRTAAVQAAVSGLQLNVPAVELFEVMSEVLRQSDEVRCLFAPAGDVVPAHAPGPSRTYTSMEAHLTNVGAMITSEAPPLASATAPAAAATSTASRDDRPWCGVSVASLRVVTTVSLESVLTSSGEPATLMDDALAVGWRMRVWHRVSTATLRGVVLAGHCGVDAQWRLPAVDVTASQPLPRTVLCVRANRDTGANEDGAQVAAASQPTSDSPPPPLAARPQRSSTDFFHVEPTAADVCGELNSHLLTRVLVEVGEAVEPAVVVVSLGTAHTLASSAAHLMELWKQHQPRTAFTSVADPEDALEQMSKLNTESLTVRLSPLSGPIMWYEVALSLRGRRLRLVSEAPAGLQRSCVMDVEADDAFTFYLDRELAAEEVEYATPRFDTVRNDDETDRDSDGIRSVAGTLVGSAAVHERFRFRCGGTLRVSDGQGNLILLLSSEGGEEEEEACATGALTAEYAASKNTVNVAVDHVLCAASPITAAFIVEWFRACQMWTRLWASPSPAAGHEREGAEGEAAAPAGKSPTSFLRLTVVVRQVEVLLAPAGFLVVKRPSFSRTLVAEGEKEGLERGDEVLQLECAEVSLHSTCAAECRRSQQTRRPQLLASIQTPLLRCTVGSAWFCRVPHVSLTNRNRHSWALCMMRAGAFVQATAALWSSSAPDFVAGRNAEEGEGGRQNIAKGVSSRSTHQLIVESAELRCFAAGDEETSTCPALQLRAEHVELTVPVGDVPGGGGGASTAQAKVSATCRFAAGDASSSLSLSTSDLVVLEESVVTAAARALPENAGSALDVSVAPPGFRVHLPAGDALESLVSALSMVLAQSVPRRLPEVTDQTAPTEKEEKRAKEETQRWRLTVRVPSLSCDVADSHDDGGMDGQRLVAFALQGLFGQLQTRGAERRPEVEVRVAAVHGETDVCDGDVKEKTPVRFLFIEPLPAATQKATTTNAAGSTAAETHQQVALLLQQKSLALSQQDNGNTSAGNGRFSSQCEEDEATSLTVRLPTLHTHVTLALVQRLAMSVLRPIRSGMRSAAATAADQSIMKAFISTAVQVNHPNTPLPPLGPLERHAALVRVIEVRSDWTLTQDLHLGGSGGGLQLHFCSTASRNVITVRGDGIVTIFLSCCETVNGDRCPAIRVDADLTVKFDHVRVVVEGYSGAQPLSDTFVMAGERALCLFPRAPSTKPPTLAQPLELQTTSTTAVAPAMEVEALGERGAPECAAVWPVTSLYTVDVRVGFAASLTARLRSVSAVGTWQLRYRFEDKRKGSQTVRREREGESHVTLQSCATETAPLTRTPFAFAMRLGHNKEECDRLRLAVSLGSTQWQLSLGHAQLLAAAAESLISALVQTRATVAQVDVGHSAAVWVPPPALGAASSLRGRNGDLSPTPIDLAWEAPRLSLCLTDDLAQPLVACSVAQLRLTCTTDTELSDVVLGAAASLSVTDRLSSAAGEAHDDGTSRVLFAAQPSLSLVWTRFGPDSRSFSLSVNIDHVVATLPLTTALRAVARVRMDTDAGTRAFCNDTGIELVVAAASPQESRSVSNGGGSAGHEGRTVWRLPASSAEGGNVQTTGIPAAVAELGVAPGAPTEGSVDQPLAINPVVSHSDQQVAALNLRLLETNTVYRLRLPGYTSPVGALDIVVRQCVRGGMDVVHLATTVEMTNAFFAAIPGGVRDTAVTLRGGERSSFVVASRSTRCLPLSILKERVALEMGGGAYAPRTNFLTWAMLADAMTLMADLVAAGASSASGGGAAAENLRRLLAEVEKSGGGDGRQRGALCGQARVVDATTVTFPVLLRMAAEHRGAPQPCPASGEAAATPTKGGAAVEEATGLSRASSLHSTPVLESPDRTTSAASRPQLQGRVVQLTWRRHCSQQPSHLLFSGRLPPCEYTVTVGPVWTLWNCTGCRLRLRLRRETEGKHAASVDAGAAVAASVPSTAGDVIASAVVEDGACFQWTPASLAELDAAVSAIFQVEAPFVSPPQWWSAAAPISLTEPPPPYIRLQQSPSLTRGAVQLERHSSSTVVVRCAALLHSAMSQSVYLRDASRPLPVLGTGAQGCLHPQQVLPLFFSEYVTTPTPNATKVGFTVRETPLRGKLTDVREETDPYFLTSPIAATVLSDDARDDCTVFYAVSACDDTAAPVEEMSLWRPAPPPRLQLRALCSVHNSDPHRTLYLRPFIRGDDAPAATLAAVSIETCVPPGTTREVHRFGAHAGEPDVHLCYSEPNAVAPAHDWSPPVKLLSLATSTLPLVVKHTCAATATESRADAVRLLPVPRSVQEAALSTTEYCHCLALQSTTTEGRLCVVVRLQTAPPLRVVNRVNTVLQYSQLLTRRPVAAKSSSSTGGGAAAAATVAKDAVSTTLCSRTSPPRSYFVPPETTGYGCWEVPTLEFQGLRVTLHSNRCRGLTASVDVDVLQCAAAPSSGLRVGDTDAYVYVSLNHRTHQYTITVVPTRQLESRMLFQPRRLTQIEVFVPRCSLYVAAVTLPTTGPFSRTSVVARGARGRLRAGGKGSGGAAAAEVVVPRSATDEDVCSVLRQVELDVLCVRVVGLYGSVTMTERHVLGSASVGIVEVLDCTTPEAVYPVVLRMSSGTASDSKESSSSTAAVAVAGDASPASSTSAPALTSSVAPSGVVPRFKDPSWCNVELHLTRTPLRSGGAVMVPLQYLRVSMPPIAVHLHDELLFTLRTSAEGLLEEMAATPRVANLQPAQQQQQQQQQRLSAARLSRTVSQLQSSAGDMGGAQDTEALCTTTTAASPPDATRRSGRTVYNVFLYELQVSAITTEVTYTRTDDRRCNPFRNLSGLPVHLIPSLEGLRIVLTAVKLANVELLSTTSLASVITSFVWPLYRTQLLLQSYKVLGSLDLLGNPRALLGSWSRGVWDLVTNASGKSRWADTRDFLRTTTSSTLHSVGMLARSLGNLAGVSPSASASASASGGADSGLAAADSSQRRGFFREVLAEVRGGVTDAVTKPIRGARDGGVNGFLVGVASGVVGLVGRPMFGFFRGVSATSEFYARLLGGHTTLTEQEARRLALKRNYNLTDDTAAGGVRDEGVAGEKRKGGVAMACGPFERLMADIPRWRRGDEANVRAAVTRAGVHNAALFLPYTASSAFLAPHEFAESLPSTATALLCARLLYALTHERPRATAALSGGRAATRSDTADLSTTAVASRSSGVVVSSLSRECSRAVHIKESLGVVALRKYVSADVFVRVCTLAELTDAVPPAELQQQFVILLAKTVNAVGDDVFMP